MLYIYVILGATPIILAAIGGHLPLVQVPMLTRILIISKLSVTNLGSYLPRISASNQPWSRVEPPFHFFTFTFQLLINLGAELNHQDRATGWTCLMQVPKIIVQSLVTFFWFIWLQLHLICHFLKNWRIQLALQATFYGHSEVVTTLLEAGADPTVR